MFFLIAMVPFRLKEIYGYNILFWGNVFLPLSGESVRGHEVGNSEAYRFLHGHGQSFPSRVCFGEGRGKSERGTA